MYDDCVLLQNGLSEVLTPATWNALLAADRWVSVRERLLKLAPVVDESAQDALEALCFLVDETLTDPAYTETLQRYETVLQEVTDVLVAETSDFKVQAFLIGELQKLTLPA